MQEKKEQEQQELRSSSVSASVVNTALPLSMAFVQLFFNIFPALASFGGVGDKGTPLGGTDGGKYFKRHQEPLSGSENAESTALRGEHHQQRDERQPLNPNNIKMHHPYRGFYPASSTENKSQLQQPIAFGSPLSPGQELTLLPAGAVEQMVQPDGATAQTADYNELKFYGQLKQLLDLPILFAICFIQLISFVLVLNIEECSPLVLFSWWRNKIS